MDEIWVQEAERRLGGSGRRNGAARKAVIELLARRECCSSALEVFDALRADGTAAGLASVYRVLDLLAARGLVQRVELGDGKTRFERVPSSGEHHHHLVCNDCGTIEPFQDSRLERALTGIGDRRSYTIDAHDVVLRGACSRCDPGVR